MIRNQMTIEDGMALYCSGFSSSEFRRDGETPSWCLGDGHGCSSRMSGNTVT